MTQFDFQNGNRLVPAHQHPRGGGWVADTAIVDDTAYVGPDALVFGNALVSGHSQVSGHALVYDNAQVYDNALVYGNARVYGNALVFGNARVSGDARVFGDAVINTTKFPQIKRSDGYDFIAVRCSDGKTRVIAGCRYFTFKEAKKHWKETRGGTLLGDETMLILEYLQKYVEMMK